MYIRVIAAFLGIIMMSKNGIIYFIVFPDKQTTGWIAEIIKSLSHGCHIELIALQIILNSERSTSARISLYGWSSSIIKI